MVRRSLASLQNSFVKYLPWMQKTARLAFPNLDTEKRAEDGQPTSSHLVGRHGVRLGERAVPTILEC